MGDRYHRGGCGHCVAHSVWVAVNRSTVALPDDGRGSTRWLKEAKALLILMGDSPKAREQFYHQCSRTEKRGIMQVCGEWQRGARVMKRFDQPTLKWTRAIAVVLSWRESDGEKAL